MTPSDLPVILLDELFAAFQATGKPVLPEGRREEVVRLLTRVVTEPDVYDAYTAALRAGRESLGPKGKREFLTASGPEVPWDRIREEGFAGLSDEVLADLATSPEALQVLDESQFSGEGEIGKWFFDAVLQTPERRSSQD